MSAKILIVEDEPSICENVVYALEADGFVVSTAATGRAALDLMKAQEFNLVILDVGLPDMTGFEVCREIRKTRALPVLFLTARSSEVDRVVGLEIGGDDYVVKPFSPRELVARVRAILRRVSAVPLPAQRPDTTVPLVIDDVRCQAIYYGTALNLSRYEFRMLKAFAAHPGRVFSREQLMDHASEEPDASMERTVDTHVKTLRARMRGVRAGLEPIVTHRGMGYSLLETWPD
ncbi:two-component system response regulator CreB [Prosthecobacter vanneervenii]|uniref:Two-component system catabolic regulation response regulator CreB n=1 Tax=Prosthecobacter vanneervenii TaxID=48466 RepID=A0A7W7Y9E9_9BACT|nr:two-component system response regulator CreB [Prosthecobacter vanneervenii]MBB5032011.1 two-component system catabolic regulation response regulator CreB [Prosthecobacter vanneervenii]